jgi:hypothetical protein
VLRVNGGDQLEVGVVDDGLAHGPAHPPTGPEDADRDHQYLLGRRRKLRLLRRRSAKPPSPR